MTLRIAAILAAVVGVDQVALRPRWTQVSGQGELSAVSSLRPNRDEVVEVAHGHYGLEMQQWQRGLLAQCFGGHSTAIVGHGTRAGKPTIRKWLAAYFAEHLCSSGGIRALRGAISGDCPAIVGEIH